MVVTKASNAPLVIPAHLPPPAAASSRAVGVRPRARRSHVTPDFGGSNSGNYATWPPKDAASVQRERWI